jgi:hypothetical protein
MLTNEFYKPKISKPIERVATDYVTSDQYYDDKFDNLCDSLKKMGWRFLDDGAYSKVFANSKKNYILKINSSPDKGYATYVDLIHKYRNKHFPKISDMKKIEFEGNIFYVYLIEKLKHIPSPMDDEWSLIISKIAENPNKPLEKLFANAHKLRFGNVGGKNIPTFLIKNPSIVQAAKLIGYNMDGYCLDIHRHNIMQRPDGTIVITDPYA